MALTLTLDPHGEQLVAACLRTGRYHSPEEVVARALESLAESPDEAIAQILGLRPEVVEELRRQARARGRAVKSYAAGLLEEAARLRAACDETASPRLQRMFLKRLNASRVSADLMGFLSAILPFANFVKRRAPELRRQ